MSQKSETVAENGDCVAEFGDSLTFARQSHFSATVWTGYKLTRRRHADQQLQLVTVTS